LFTQICIFFAIAVVSFRALRKFFSKVLAVSGVTNGGGQVAFPGSSDVGSF